MKKALLVTRVSGFVPQFEMNNVKILQQMGYEVHYAANFDVVVYGTDNDRLKGTGIVCHHIPFCRSPFSPRVRDCFRQLKRLMLSEKFDLVHCHMPMTGVITRMAAQSVRRKTGGRVPVLYTAHGFHFCKGAPLANWLYYLPERWLARYTDCLITVNQEDYIRALTFPVRGKVVKIPGIGIELPDNEGAGGGEEAEGAREKWSAGRSALGFRDSDFVLVSVGELNANKNHMEVLKMLAQYRDPTIKYIVCGEGAHRELLERYVQEQGLGARVSFLGYRPDIPEILAGSDLFLFPSLREGLSVAVMEAMKAGLPVVAKKIRGNVDLIEQGEGGILVEHGTPAEYAEAVRYIKDHPGTARRMGTWNQRHIRNFSEEKVEEKMREIYSGVSGLR